MRNSILTCAALILGLVSSAHAQTYTITGGNWDFQSSWNTNATGTPNTLVYDNGAVGDAALLAGTAGIVNWAPALPASYGGTYSGSITTDGSGNVTGGSLVVTGDIGYQVLTGAPGAQNSWWAHSYTGLTLNFDTMTASVTDYVCSDSGLAPATCAAGGASPATVQFALTAGAEGIGGAARPAATFDGTTLTVFAEGYSAPGPGTDYLNQFTLTADTGGGGPDVAGSDLTEGGNTGGTGDFAVLVSGVDAQVDIHDAATGGAPLNSITYFPTATNTWVGIAIDTLSDANQDGVADDAAIAMLALDTDSNRIAVQTRLASDDSAVGAGWIQFFNSSGNWTPIDVAVINDLNGDGNTNDAAIAVLAQNSNNNRYVVQVKSFSTRAQLLRRGVLRATWGGGSIEAYVPGGGGDSVIVTMGLRTDGATVLQKHQVSNGVRLGTIFAFGPAIAPADITIVADGNSDGAANDPAVVVLGDRVSNGNVVTRKRDLASGAHLATNFAFSAHLAERIGSVSDANGNNREEISISARAAGTDALTVRVRDSQTNWIVNDTPL